MTIVQKFVSLLLLIFSLYLVSIPYTAMLTRSLLTTPTYQKPEPITFSREVVLSGENISLEEKKNKLTASLRSKAACVMDGDTGRVLFGKSETEKLPMASTTKIMSCIIALEKGNLNDTVTFSKYAASMPDVQLNAASGEQFLLKDLLYSLMLESHNDTAVAIAEHVGGSVEGFAELMNAKAAELGLTSTHFVTPNGLDADTHYTTAEELSLIAAYAIRNETFVSIIGTPSHSFKSINKKRTYKVNNKDRFLTMYDGAIGVKTGFTGKAGYCFTGAVKKDGKTLISSVLACGWPPNKSLKWKDTKALMNFGMNNFSYKTLSADSVALPSLPVENGTKKSTTLSMPKEELSLSMLLSSEDKVTLQLELPDSLEAPLREGDIIGYASLIVNNEVQKKVPISNRQDIAELDFPYTLFSFLKQALL